MRNENSKSFTYRPVEIKWQPYGVGKGLHRIRKLERVSPDDRCSFRTKRAGLLRGYGCLEMLETHPEESPTIRGAHPAAPDPITTVSIQVQFVIVRERAELQLKYSRPK